MVYGDTCIHSTAVKVDVYPDEFKPIMKALKYTLLCEARDAVLTHEEWETVNSFLDSFSDIALNEAV